MQKLLLFFLIGFISVAFAGVGKVTGLKGEAVIERAGKVINVTNSMQIEKSDVIKTLGDGRVKLTFNDNTVISIGKKAVFSVIEYVNTEQKNPEARFSIVKGAFKAISGKIGKVAPKKFTVKTRNATIGIRGTVFLGYIYPQDGKEDIACTKGAITVTSGNQAVDVDAGNYVKLENARFGEVKPLDSEVKNTIEEKVTVSKTDENTDEQTQSSDETTSDEADNTSDDDSQTSTADDSPESSSSDDSQTSTTEDSTESLSSDDSQTSISEDSTDSSTSDVLTTWSGTETDTATETASGTTTDAASSATTDATTDTTTSTVATNLSGYQLSGYKESANQSNNFVAKGSSSYKYDATSKYTAEGYSLTQDFQNDASSDTITMSDNFTHTPSTTPTTGGYTGFSQITTTNPLTYSVDRKYDSTITDNYTLYMDNMGEFLVGYGNKYDYYDMFYAGSKSDASTLNSSKYYTYSEFKGIRLVMSSSDVVSEVKFDTINSTYKNIYLNGKFKIVIPESQFTDEDGAIEFGSYKVADDGSIESGVHYYKHYSGTNDTYSATSKGSAVDGAIFGSDFQGLGVTFEDKEYENYGSVGSTNTQNLLNTDYNAHTAYLTGSSTLADSYISGEEMSGYRVYSTNAGFNVSWNALTMTVYSDTGSVNIDDPDSTGLTAGGTISAGTSYYLNDDAFGVMIKSGSTLTIAGNEYTYIDDSGWFVSRADEYDSSSGKFVVNNDDYSSWGYWTGEFVKSSDADTFKHVDMRSTWVVGQKTNAASLTALDNLVGNTSATYKGHILGMVSNGTKNVNIDMNAQNQFQMTFDFGAGTATVDKFQFTAEFTAGTPTDIAPANLAATDVGNVSFDITQNSTTVGQGTYYGPNAESIGGRFIGVTSGAYTANGVFKAARN